MTRREYAKRDGDARKYDPRLRPPIDPAELRVDPRTGMKVQMVTYRLSEASIHPDLYRTTLRQKATAGTLRQRIFVVH